MPRDPKRDFLKLFIYLPLSYCDIKQTGDLLYSSGQQGHTERERGRERGVVMETDPLSGCQNCLIIQDHHCWASARIQLEPLKRLKDEIKKLYKVVSWGKPNELPLITHAFR